MAPDRQQFGDFEIVREIGRGGMGIVFEAEQISLRRKVALKIMSGSLGITPKAAERFRREAEAAARLHHTNIVPIYTFGDHDGTPFYAMELVAGTSLDRALKQMRQPEQPSAPGDSTVTGPNRPDSQPRSAESSTCISSLSSGTQEYFDQAARMIAEVADALEHAHRHGIIHRDIKPSNLLLSPDGRLSVNDFGLARILEQPGVTVTGEFVGTPAYMSPEQITAGRTPLDHRTDIYSLGATLYEMLTHQRPFIGERREQILAQILHKEPRPPRRINGAIPRDLETICLKALEKDPDRRYQSAGAMAEDLRRFVQRFAISARRVGPFGRFSKWVRRHPAVSAATACALVLAVVAGVFFYQLRTARLEKALNGALLAGHDLDFETAMRAVDEYRAAGASPGKLAFLRGFIAINQRESKWNAVEELEKAVALLPDDVSARALLTRAYYSADRMADYYESMERVESLTPRTPEDYLFSGHVMGLSDPRCGMERLNHAIKMKNSVLARRIRATVGSILAESTVSVELAQQALDDLAAARTMAPEYKPNNSSFWTYMHVAVVYRVKQLPVNKAQAEEKARIDAEFLDNHSGRRGYIIVCHEAAEDDEAIVSEYERWKPNQLTYFGMKGALHALARRGEFEKARRLLDDADATGYQMIHHVERGIIEALAQRPAQALAAYHEAVRFGPRLRAELHGKDILLMLGRKQQARAVYRELSESADFAKEVARLANPKWSRQVWEFGGGKISHEELEAAARPSRYNLCEAYFHIGLDKLADGDRDGAREYFKKCTDTHIFHFLEHRWSRSLLATMERDPDWPKKK